MQILTDNKEKLHELAKILLEKETITGIEFMAVLAPNQLPSSFDDEEKMEESEPEQAVEAEETMQTEADAEADDVTVSGEDA